jgi:hypothetical protein
MFVVVIWPFYQRILLALAFSFAHACTGLVFSTEHFSYWRPGLFFCALPKSLASSFVRNTFLLALAFSFAHACTGLVFSTGHFSYWRLVFCTETLS